MSAELEPAERLALTVARAQLARGENPPINVTSVLVTAVERLAEPPGQRITHGRHCICSACAREDWTNPDLAPCGMHGSDCPALYQPWGPAGTYRDPGEVAR